MCSLLSALCFAVLAIDAFTGHFRSVRLMFAVAGLIVLLLGIADTIRLTLRDETGRPSRTAPR
jgi:hypothetical protein